MWTWIRDSFATARLKARYQRLIHERLVQFTEGSEGGPESEPRDWMPVGRGQGSFDEPQRAQARELAHSNPHARNILRLLEVYVTGPGLKLSHQPAADAGGRSRVRDRVLSTADRLWADFLNGNFRHYSAREHSRRAWRDGECFIRKFESPVWPPQVRFIDPETIGPSAEHPDSQGILTAEGDAETPIAYLRLEPGTGRLAERIDAAEILHTRVGADSNQKRGLTIFGPVIEMLTRFEKWIETELLARKLQSSIVLWRKVQGSPQQLSAFSDTAAGSADGLTGTRREPIRPGTILTTNQSTDIQFLQPNTNFGDAVPLGRMLLLNIAAGAGLPEFMLTSDASNANFASTMVAEGPAVKLFQSEQQFFGAELTRMWRWVMEDAVDLGLLPADFFRMVQPQWTFPQLVNRDRTRERLADVRLVETSVLSRAEVARRDGVDPQLMQVELRDEQSAGRPVTA